MKKEITSRQFGIMLAFAILTFKLTYFPSLLFKFAGSDGYISFLLLACLDLLTLSLILYVYFKYPNVSFAEFLESRIGKFAPKIIYTFFFIYFLFKLIYLTSAGYFYSKASVFEYAPFLLFITVLFITINSLCLFKLNSYVRTLEFFFPIVIFSFFICIALGAGTADKYGILPLFENGASGVFEAVWRNLFCFGNYFFVFIFMGKTDLKKGSIKKVLFFLGLTFILLNLFIYFYFSIFKYTGFLHIHAISDILEFVPLSSIIENLDWFPTTLVYMLYIFEATLFLFGMLNSLKEIVKFKNKKIDSRWLLLVINVLTILLIMYVFSSYEAVIFFAQNYFNFFIAIMYLLAAFIFVLSFKKVKETKIQKVAIKSKNYTLKWANSEKIKEKISILTKNKLGGSYEIKENI